MCPVHGAADPTAPPRAAPRRGGPRGGAGCCFYAGRVEGGHLDRERAMRDDEAVPTGLRSWGWGAGDDGVLFPLLSSGARRWPECLPSAVRAPRAAAAYAAPRGPPRTASVSPRSPTAAPSPARASGGRTRPSSKAAPPGRARRRARAACASIRTRSASARSAPSRRPADPRPRPNYGVVDRAVARGVRRSRSDAEDEERVRGPIHVRRVVSGLQAAEGDGVPPRVRAHHRHATDNTTSLLCFRSWRARISRAKRPPASLRRTTTRGGPARAIRATAIATHSASSTPGRSVRLLSPYHARICATVPAAQLLSATATPSSTRESPARPRPRSRESRVSGLLEKVVRDAKFGGRAAREAEAEPILR